MSVDTKLYLSVPTYNKTAITLPILRATIAAIKGQFPEDRLRGVSLMREFGAEFKAGDPVYKDPQLRATVVEDALVDFTLNFVFKGERRQLNVFFDCDCDVRKYVQGPGVVFSLGCWGSSDQLMRAILEKVRGFGKVWYIENDSNDEVVEFEARVMSPEESVALFGTPYYLAPEHLAQTGETAVPVGEKVYVR